MVITLHISAIAFSPYNFKILPTHQLEFCGLVTLLNFFGDTIISNITVLASHNVICFGYFMSMTHGVNKKAPQIASPQPLPYTRFSPGLFVALQEILYQPSFALLKLLQKIMHFQNNTNFFFQLIAGLF